jgi:hypothetical protein
MNLQKGDDELTERLRAGDISAFDELYFKYNLKVYYFSLKYLHIDEEARDLVQTVFLKIWDNLDILRKRKLLPFVPFHYSATMKSVSYSEKEAINLNFYRRNLRRILIPEPNRMMDCIIKQSWVKFISI